MIRPGDNPALEHFVAKHPDVKALPESSMHIIQLCNDPSTTLPELQKVVSIDPAIAGQLLKSVNSAFYSLPNKVTRLDMAISLLGLRSVKDVALSACFGSKCGQGRLGTYTARDLWGHCIATAVAARALATQATSVDPEEAFLAGMVHDIGLLLMIQADPESAKLLFAAVEKKPDQSFLTHELNLLGYTHCELGEYLAAAWDFPESIATGIRHHHNPADASDDFRKMAEIIYTADMIASELSNGFSLTTHLQTLDGPHLNHLNITKDAVTQISKSLPPMLTRLAA